MVPICTDDGLLDRDDNVAPVQRGTRWTIVPAALYSPGTASRSARGRSDGADRGPPARASMSKAFTRETDADPDDRDDDQADALPAHTKNYVTPTGHAALQSELRQLLHEERPKVVDIVSWAASNGDRSENADYLYGKKRLREIDRRVRYLTKRLESAVLVDPRQQQALRQVFFGATVTYARQDGSEHTVTLVGVDEADLSKGKISWLSPVAQALMKAKVDDSVRLRTPAGVEDIEIVAIRYG